MQDRQQAIWKCPWLFMDVFLQTEIGIFGGSHGRNSLQAVDGGAGTGHCGIRSDVGRDPRHCSGNYSIDWLKCQQCFFQRGKFYPAVIGHRARATDYDWGDQQWA